MKAIYIIEVVLGFGALIFVHELGHFLAAKYNGVKVLKFAIGFDFWGLRLLKRKIGETEYVIGAFPLGGYVKMLGQEDLPEDGGAEPAKFPEGHFLSKSVWQRTQIISAGVIANFLLTFVLCYGAYLVGFRQYEPEVGAVGFDSLQAGMRPGDVIESVGGDHVESWTEMFMAYALSEQGTDTEIVVRRDDELIPLQIPVLREPSSPINVPDFERAMGLQILAILDPSAAAEGGIEGGDVLVSVDGIEIRDWHHFSTLVSGRPGEQITLEVDRPTSKTEFQRTALTMTLDETDDPFAPTRTLGLGPGEPAVIDAVLEGSLAAQAGLQAGDRLVSVGGQPVQRWIQVFRAVEYAEPGVPLPLVVHRQHREVEIQVVPEASQHWAIGVWGLPVIGAIHRAPDKVIEDGAGSGAGGCTPSEPPRLGLTVGWVDPDGPAAAAGIQLGDVLTKAVYKNEQGEESEIELFGWSFLYSMLSSSQVADGFVRLDYERDGVPMAKSVEMVPDPTGKRRGVVGVYGDYKQVWIQMGPIEALGPAVKKPFRLLDEFSKGIRAMFTGRVSPKTISGPVGILEITYSAASSGLGDLLLLLALISVNLAIINFLPIPITDGGHFVFLVLEKVRGRRLSEEVQGKIMWAGLVFLLLVFVFATWNDFGRIFTR